MTKAEKLQLKEIEEHLDMPWHTPARVKKDFNFLLKLVRRYLK